MAPRSTRRPFLWFFLVKRGGGHNAPPTEMLRMSLKLQIKESNRKDVFELLILNEKNKVCLRDVKIWRHDVIHRYTAKMWRHKIKKLHKQRTTLRRRSVNPSFFSLSVGDSFSIPKFQIHSLSVWKYAENEHFDVTWRHLTSERQIFKKFSGTIF